MRNALKTLAATALVATTPASAMEFQRLPNLFRAPQAGAQKPTPPVAPYQACDALGSYAAIELKLLKLYADNEDRIRKVEDMGKKVDALSRVSTDEREIAIKGLLAQLTFNRMMVGGKLASAYEMTRQVRDLCDLHLGRAA